MLDKLLAYQKFSKAYREHYVEVYSLIPRLPLCEQRRKYLLSPHVQGEPGNKTSVQDLQIHVNRHVDDVHLCSM